MLWTLLLVSILVFIIVNLPPGNIIESMIDEARRTGGEAAMAKALFLEQEFALQVNFQPRFHVSRLRMRNRGSIAVHGVGCRQIRPVR